MVTPTSNRPHRIFIDIQCVHTSLLLVNVILNPEGMIEYEVICNDDLWRVKVIKKLTDVKFSQLNVEGFTDDECN